MYNKQNLTEIQINRMQLEFQVKEEVQSEGVSVLLTQLGIARSNWPALLGKCLYQQSARTPVDCQRMPQGGGTR